MYVDYSQNRLAFRSRLSLNGRPFVMPELTQPCRYHSALFWICTVSYQYYVICAKSLAQFSGVLTIYKLTRRIGHNIIRKKIEEFTCEQNVISMF